jgi:hypothetical protein
MRAAPALRSCEDRYSLPGWPDSREPFRAAQRARRKMSKAQRTLTVYRYLTGPDDASFCHRVTQALSAGWTLYGSPTLAFDAATGRVICGHAVTKDLEGQKYSADLKLSEL